MKNKIFGYGRVSSKDQNEDRQIAEFKKLKIEDRDIFIDKKSGKDFDREQYNVLKTILREGDLLVIDSIDRLGRNYNMILEEWRDITKRIKADIKVIDMPLLDTTLHRDLLGTFVCDLVLQVLSFNAHKQRESINRNQRKGIDVAKAKGIKFGRPKIEKPQNFDNVVNKWQHKEIKTKEAIEMLGLKPNTFYNMVKEIVSN